MSRRVNDKFTRMARNKGFPARSVFKLKEIHEKHRVLRQGGLVNACLHSICVGVAVAGVIRIKARYTKAMTYDPCAAR